MRIVEGNCCYFDGSFHNLKKAFVALWNDASETSRKSIKEFEHPLVRESQGPASDEVQCSQCDSILGGIMSKDATKFEKDANAEIKLLRTEQSRLEEVCKTKQDTIDDLRKNTSECDQVIAYLIAANTRNTKIIDRLL